ncbi:MAG: type II toxin-antitoxin system VapC family toxin [Chloroflexota bacterium]
MIYLDTHVVVWLYAGLVEKISEPARMLINEHEVTISPIVNLELAYLFEIERIKSEPTILIADLSSRIGLRVCERAFEAIVSQAMALSWTRDPFDRLIVANASLNDNFLVTKDKTILENYSHARW